MDTNAFIDQYNYVQIAAEKGTEENPPTVVEDLGESAVKFLQLIVKHLPPKETFGVENDIKVLDLGCNAGYNTKMLKEKYGHCIGVDLNPTLIDYATKAGNDCYVFDMHYLIDVFPPMSFNLIFAKDILEHSYNPLVLLSSLKKLLRDNGYLVAFIPMDGGDDPRIILAPGGNSAHVWKTNYKDCDETLYAAGFTNIEIHKYSVQKDIGYCRPIGDDIGVFVCR